jgi:hypothetical protein
MGHQVTDRMKAEEKKKLVSTKPLDTQQFFAEAGVFHGLFFLMRLGVPKKIKFSSNWYGTAVSLLGFAEVIVISD